MNESRPSCLEVAGALLISLVLLMLILSFVVGTVVVFPRSKSPYSPPTQFNPLGTDDLGDDILTLIIKGSRTSLSIGIIGSLVSTVIGMIIGAFSGFCGGIADDLMSGIIDLFIVIPALPLIIVLAAYLTPSFWNVIIVIGLLWWPTTARLVRARALQLRSSQFIESLVGIGANKSYIVFRHIIPNVLGIVFARFILSISHAILLEAGLSFIGLGDPINPSWGTILHFAMTRGALLQGAWWTFVPPGISISLTSLGFILLGMGLEQRLRISAKSLEESI
ncbi:MAG: ABC transporter permease [Candidatus Methanomethylicaceae archaeon]